MATIDIINTIEAENALCNRKPRLGIISAAVVNIAPVTRGLEPKGINFAHGASADAYAIFPMEIHQKECNR